MKKQLLVVLGGVMLLGLGGCVTSMVAEQAANQAAPPAVEKFSFDVSTAGTEVGTLTVQTRQPSYQAVVEKYAIKIDAGSPLVVSKQSDVTIKLNVGKHAVKLYATSSNPAESEKVTWGMASNKEVAIAKEQELKLKYTGPYRMLGAGNVEDVK